MKRSSRWQYIPFFMFCAFIWLGEALFNQYYSLYLTEKGLSSSQIGFIYAALYIVTIFAAFAIGYISDKLQNPKAVLMVLLAGVIVAIWMTSATSGIGLLTLSALLYGLFSSSSPDVADKLIVDKLQNESGMFGMIHLGDPCGYFVGTLIAGVVLSELGFSALFIFSASAFAAAFLAAAMFPQKRKPDKEKTPAKKRVPLRAIFGNPAAYYIYGNYILWGFLESAAANYTSVYVVNMGMDARIASYLSAATMLGQIIAYSISNLLLRKLSNTQAVSISFILMAVRIVALAMTPFVPIGLTLLLTLIGGVGHPLRICASVRMIVDCFPPSVGSLAQTMKNLASRGIGSSLGSIIMGNLMAIVYGPTLYCILAGSGVFFSGVLLLWSKRLRFTMHLAHTNS